MGDTTADGTMPAFPTTIWSDIVAAGDPAHPQYRQRLDQLLRSYWKPVYAYVRAAWRKSVDDAKDLTQAFFAHVLEKGYVARVASDRRSFRGYLKTALKHFVVDAERAAAVRRPEKPLWSLDAPPAELERIGPAAPDEPPERVYDRQWFACLLAASVDALKGQLEREGKRLYYEVFKRYILDPELPGARVAPEIALSLPTYHEVARQLGIRETDVGNYIRHCRTLLREIMRKRIREYVETDAEAERELEDFGKL